MEVPVPETVTDGGLNPQFNPDEGNDTAARLTVPENPLTAVIVTVDAPEVPARIVMLVGLAVMVKS